MLMFIQGPVSEEWHRALVDVVLHDDEANASTGCCVGVHQNGDVSVGLTQDAIERALDLLVTDSQEFMVRIDKSGSGWVSAQKLDDMITRQRYRRPSVCR